MSVNLSDVARLAGVSLSTASRVVSKSAYPVSETTREAVWRAVEKLNYTPNALASSLTTARSQTIGIIIGAITDPYFAEITAGVEEHGRGENVLTMVCNGGRDVTAEREYLRLLWRHRADGVVLAGGVDTASPQYGNYVEEIATAQRNGMKVVAVGPRDVPGVRSILVDDTAILADLTREVIALGHRKLVFITAAPNHTTSQLRHRGFGYALSAAGLEPVAIVRGGFDFEDGERAADEILALPELPHAVIGANDAVALGALARLGEAGVSVPDDVSVAGVDDIRETAVTGLTSVAVPLREMGRRAAASIVSGERGTEVETLPHEVKMRRSTARRSA